MLELVTYPDPILNKVCRPITDEELQGRIVDGFNLDEIVDEMTYIMRHNSIPGSGLAAPQVGLSIDLFIVDLHAATAPVPLVFINPELSDFRGKEEMVEGCLSLPGVQVKVKRPQMVKVKAKNLSGKEFESDFNGDLARVIQHEFDHTRGITILTKGNSNTKRNRDALEYMERTHKNWEERKIKK
jgi:peptide deformylase